MTDKISNFQEDLEKTFSNIVDANLEMSRLVAGDLSTIIHSTIVDYAKQNFVNKLQSTTVLHCVITSLVFNIIHALENIVDYDKNNKVNVYKSVSGWVQKTMMNYAEDKAITND